MAAPAEGAAFHQIHNAEERTGKVQSTFATGTDILNTKRDADIDRSNRCVSLSELHSVSMEPEREIGARAIPDRCKEKIAVRGRSLQVHRKVALLEYGLHRDPDVLPPKLAHTIRRTSTITRLFSPGIQKPDPDTRTAFHLEFHILLPRSEYL